MSTSKFRPRLEMLEDRCVPATFTVKNLDDFGAGSLRERIGLANAAPGLDTIVFKKGLEGTIRLTNGEIAITDNLKLTGPGAKKIAISGDFSSRIFNIDGGAAGADLLVTVKGLELRHGDTADNGGAILSAENLTLANMVFTQNRAGDNGGAISSTGTLTVNKSTISGNAGDHGAGIYNFNGVTNITSSTITGNTALVHGGGIYCNTATITSSTITRNAAGGGGGGIRIRSSATITITSSTISSNTANSSGGGIYSSDNVAIISSTISGNTAGFDGGGIRSNTATITGSTISGNRAQFGGGLFISSTGASSIRNSTFSGNQAGGDGGGIWSSATNLTVSNTTIAFNHADGLGGGMFVENSAADLVSCLIANNSAPGTDKDIENGTGGSFGLERCLIGVVDDAVITNNGNNLIGTLAARIDPKLAPLANNGGKTQTHALKKGSPAINAGSNPAGLPKDQRGGKFKRQVGGGVDIGAFERQ